MPIVDSSDDEVPSVREHVKKIDSKVAVPQPPPPPPASSHREGLVQHPPPAPDRPQPSTKVTKHAAAKHQAKALAREILPRWDKFHGYDQTMTWESDEARYMAVATSHYFLEKTQDMDSFLSVVEIALNVLAQMGQETERGARRKGSIVDLVYFASQQVMSAAPANICTLHDVMLAVLTLLRVDDEGEGIIIMPPAGLNEHSISDRAPEKTINFYMALLKRRHPAVWPKPIQLREWRTQGPARLLPAGWASTKLGTHPRQPRLCFAQPPWLWSVGLALLGAGCLLCGSLGRHAVA